jgi:chromosome segregation ATPase
MADERLIQRLEEQLRDAHATTADLREQLSSAEKFYAEYHATRRALEAQRQSFDDVGAAKDAAVRNAAAAQRKAKDAQMARLRAEEKTERLEDELGRASVELDRLRRLEDAIEKATGIEDLFGS